MTEAIINYTVGSIITAIKNFNDNLESYDKENEVLQELIKYITNLTTTIDILQKCSQDISIDSYCKELTDLIEEITKWVVETLSIPTDFFKKVSKFFNTKSNNKKIKVYIDKINQIKNKIKHSLNIGNHHLNILLNKQMDDLIDTIKTNPHYSNIIKILDIQKEIFELKIQDYIKEIEDTERFYEKSIKEFDKQQKILIDEYNQKLTNIESDNINFKVKLFELETKTKDMVYNESKSEIIELLKNDNEDLKKTNQILLIKLFELETKTKDMVYSESKSEIIELLKNDNKDLKETNKDLRETNKDLKETNKMLLTQLLNGDSKKQKSIATIEIQTDKEIINYVSIDELQKKYDELQKEFNIVNNINYKLYEKTYDNHNLFKIYEKLESLQILNISQLNRDLIKSIHIIEENCKHFSLDEKMISDIKNGYYIRHYHTELINIIKKHLDSFFIIKIDESIKLEAYIDYRKKYVDI